MVPCREQTRPRAEHLEHATVGVVLVACGVHKLPRQFAPDGVLANDSSA